MLSQYNVIEFDIVLRKTQPKPPFPPAADRADWQQFPMIFVDFCPAVQRIDQP